MNLTKYLGQYVEIIIDRPLGSKHPKYGFTYEVNYGFVPNTKAPDGEEIDAYLLGSSEPLGKAHGKCIAIIKRKDDEDDKLVVVLSGAANIKDEDIMSQVNFQEKYFKTKIIRCN